MVLLAYVFTISKMNVVSAPMLDTNKVRIQKGTKAFVIKHREIR